MDKNKTIIRSTTVVCVRDNESVVIASDGQVTLGTSVIKSNANKIRTFHNDQIIVCLLYTSPSPRDKRQSRMPSSA